MAILHTFLNGLNFVKMSPTATLIKAGVPENASVFGLADAGKTYAIYIEHGRPMKEAAVLSNYFVDRAPQEVSLTLDIPTGSYNAIWMDPKTGEISKSEIFASRGDARAKIQSPRYSEDIALKITRNPGALRNAVKASQPGAASWGAD